MSRKVIPSLPDGSCMYRSLATGLLYLYNGRICPGAPWGAESTLGEISHNLVTRWIRFLVQHSMCQDTSITIDSRIGDWSLATVLHVLTEMIEKRGILYAFESKREQRYFIRKYLPTKPRRPRPINNDPYPCGLVPTELSVSGREDKESFATYCKRLSFHETWGGEAECYVASHIIGLPIEVFMKNQTKRAFLYGLSEKNIRIYSLVLLYDAKKNHYDAIVRSDQLPPLVTYS